MRKAIYCFNQLSFTLRLLSALLLSALFIGGWLYLKQVHIPRTLKSLNTTLQSIQKDIRAIKAASNKNNIFIYEKDLTQPENIGELLRDLIQRIPTLSLINVKFSTPEALGKASGKRRSKKKKKAKAKDAFQYVTQKAKLKSSKLKKQKITLQFFGDYQGTVSYLEKLKKTGEGIFWDNISYTVSKHPQAKVILNLYALYV